MQRLLVAVSLVLFVAACFAPALSFRVYSSDPARYTIEVNRGGNILFIGWMGVLVGQVAWVANPPWVLGIGLLFFERIKGARILLTLAALLALSTLRLYRSEMPYDEGGVTKMLLQAPLLGFYLWLSSIVLALVAAFV
jgi:hypothetical protein